MAGEDYAPVATPDEEEERRRVYGDFPPAYAPPLYVGMGPTGPETAPENQRRMKNAALSAAPAETPASAPSLGKEASLKSPDAPPAIAPVPTPAQTRLRALTEQGAPPVQPLHGFKKGLDILGQIAAPRIEERLRYRPQAEYERNLKAAEGDVTAENLPEETARKAAQETATTEKTKAETENLQNPKEEWSTVPGIIGPNGEPIQQEKRSGEMRYGPVTGGPLKPPATTQEQNKLAFQGVAAKVDAAGLPTGPKEIDKSLDAALKRRVITADEHAKAKAYQAANPTPATNLQVTIAGAQQKQGFEHTEKQEAETYKRYETAQDADQRLSRMEAAYQKALKGDQQAMLALLTDHIGMTLGLQKGARITKDILNEATASMPWLEKIESKFDDRGYLSGVTLGPEQMAQMLDLGYEARDRAVQGAQDSSKLYGVAEPSGAAEVFGKRKIGEKPVLQKGAQGGEAPEGTVIDVNGQKQVKRGGKWVPQ